MAILYVKKDGSGNSTTIQGAIALAQAGDTVEVEAGTFDENIDLYKGIILKGAGLGSTIVTGLTRSAITSKTFTWTLGATVLNISAGNNTDAYEVGRIVTATGIPANARILSKTSSSLTISAATTQAATTARAVAMALQNDATIRVRGTNGVIRGIKFVGFDNPNPSTEYSAIYLRNIGLGSAAANGWEIFENEFVADGEYAILTDYASGVANLNFHDNVISGKTFKGDNPATGNQFSVWNVPRQLITIQGVNVNVTFQNNEITGITGGLTVDGVPSYNTAVTIDPVGALISGNTINTVSGTGFGLRARGLNAVVQGNYNIGSTAGLYILPNHSVGVSVSVGTMVLSSSKYYICTQAHTSSATNAPTGVDGALYWSEITLEQVNASGVYGIALQVIGSNSNVIAVLLTLDQASAGSPVSLSFDKAILKQISKVSSSAYFSQEANWRMVACIFKHDSSAKRLTAGFKDFEASKDMKLKSGMSSGQSYELIRMIVSDSSRQLLSVERSEIEGASDFDFVLK